MPARALRLIVPAAVAVVAWFASDALDRLGMSSGSTLMKVMRLIAPDTIGVAIEAPGPWGAWIVVASVLAIGGGWAVLALLLRAGRGAAGFASGWLAAILAGVLAIGIPAAVEMVADALDPAALASAPSDLIAAGAAWGVLWGWMPALAAVLLAPRPAVAEAPAGEAEAPASGASASVPEASPTARRPWAALLTAGALAAVGLVMLAIGVPRATDAWHAAGQAELAASEAASEAAAEAGYPPGPAPTGTPIPEIAPGEWTIDPSWCTENQLAFAPSRADAATGHRGMSVTATNTSNAPCVLDGYPDVAFSDPVGNGFETRVLHGDGMMTEPDAGPVRLEIAPGATAKFWLAWDAPAASDQEPAGFMHVAPYPGAMRQMVPVDTDITGGELEVTAWQAGDPSPAG